MTHYHSNVSQGGMWPIRDAILWHDRKAVQPRIHTKTAHRNRTTQCPQPLNALSKTTLQFTWSITMFSFDWGLHSALNLKLVRFAFARVKNQNSIQYMKSRGASTLLITWVAQPEKGSLCPCDFWRRGADKRKRLINSLRSEIQRLNYHYLQVYMVFPLYKQV